MGLTLLLLLATSACVGASNLKSSMEPGFLKGWDPNFGRGARLDEVWSIGYMDFRWTVIHAAFGHASTLPMHRKQCT